MPLGTCLGVVFILSIISFFYPFLEQVSLRYRPLRNLVEPHAFLLNKKMPLNKASFKDFYMINGISFNLAKSLDSYLAKNQPCEVKDLIKIKGVGEKKLIILKNHFF